MFEFSKGAVVMLHERGREALDMPTCTGAIYGHIVCFNRIGKDNELVVRIQLDNGNEYLCPTTWLITQKQNEYYIAHGFEPL